MFFEKRCLVCEDTKSNPRRLICSRPKCRTEYAALKRHETLGMWAGSSHAQGRSANPIKQGVCEADKAAPAYHIVAGPALTAEQLRLATVGASEAHAVHPGLTPDQYAVVCRDVELGRISRESFEAWQAEIPPNRRREISALIGPGDVPLNLIGGHRFPSAKAAEVLPVMSEAAE
jgi:hypothetical protein